MHSPTISAPCACAPSARQLDGWHPLAVPPIGHWNEVLVLPDSKHVIQVDAHLAHPKDVSRHPFLNTLDKSMLPKANTPMSVRERCLIYVKLLCHLIGIISMSCAFEKGKRAKCLNNIYSLQNQPKFIFFIVQEPKIWWKHVWLLEVHHIITPPWLDVQRFQVQVAANSPFKDAFSRPCSRTTSPTSIRSRQTTRWKTLQFL